MLSRISGNTPLASSANIAPQAAPAPAPAPAPLDEGVVMHADAAAQASGNAIDDSKAAAIAQFWLPNDVWSCITPFSPREDLLNLRITSKELNIQADKAIHSLCITPHNLQDYIHSNSFRCVKTLTIRGLDREVLDVLTAYLASHPHPKMTLDLRNAEVDADNLARLSTATLQGLLLKYYRPFRAELVALTGCTFPIDLEAEFFDPYTLSTAVDLPTLRRFTTHATFTQINEEIAARFVARGALEALSVRADDKLSPQTLQLLASIPTLREFQITGMDGQDFDIPTACALAANPSLETLQILWRGTAGLNEDGFTALSQSQTLASLHVPLREGMTALANMTSLRNLILSVHNVPLDKATAQSIASLPALESIELEVTGRAPGALTMILKDGAARKMTIWGGSDMRLSFSDEERAALMANKKLNTLIIPLGYVCEPDRRAILDHPTIDLVHIEHYEYTRVPGSNGPLKCVRSLQ